MMKRIHNSSLTVVAAVAVVAVMLLSGCRAYKQAATSAPKAAVWERVQVPVTVNITEPQNMSIGGSLTMVRDSSAMLSLRFIGMEVGMLAVNPDSVTAVIKPQKMAVVASVSKIFSSDGVPLSGVQDLLTGNQPQKRMPLLSDLGAFVYISNSNNPILDNALIVNNGKHILRADYGEAADTPFGPMATTAKLILNPDAKPVSVTLTYNWSKAKWNDEVTPRSVNVPANYRIISSSNILKPFLNL